MNLAQRVGTLLLAAALAGPALAANPRVELRTNLGAITLELYADKAPRTVENFLQYVKDGFYDGTLFHRVIPKFMIQGGGFTADFVQKPTRAPIRNEADNGLKNTAGTIAMARTSDPHSATAQFFINVADNRELDFRYPTQEGWGYCVFGRVVKGMEVVERIARVKTGPGPGGHRDVPVKPVVIERARLLGEAEKPSK
ncbi:MAG TPA: peptidylprolyl isomerase [Burkholderiales bacterium]|nr:peptidylprolyl isomerase [Burkholderiales bacterium]